MEEGRKPSLSLSKCLRCKELTPSATTPKILVPFGTTVKGVSVRASGPRQRRRIVRERHAAFQEKVRKIGNPVGTEEAAALREAERQAQAQDDPGPQEDAPEAFGRQAGNSLGEDFPEAEEDADCRALEFDVLLRLVSHLARTLPGRRVLAQSTPAFDEDSIRELLEETAEAWQLRARHGRLPLAGIEDIRGALDSLADAGGSAR